MHTVWIYADAEGKPFTDCIGTSLDDLKKKARERYGRDYFGVTVKPCEFQLQLVMHLTPGGTGWKAKI